MLRQILTLRAFAMRTPGLLVVATALGSATPLAASWVGPDIWAVRAAPLLSDTLRGLVTDSAKKGLSGALVALAELGRNVATGKDGSFAFIDVPSGRYSMTVRAVGYAPVLRVITTGTAERLSFTLAPTSLRLEPITVTATREAIAPLASPLSTSALSGERLRREHEVSLAHAIDGLAGVRMLSTGGQVGKPVIRGLTGPRALVLDNGLRLEDYSWSDEDGPSIDARMAERVEVIRGPASVLYGSDALGGVINVVADEVPDARGLRSFVRGAAEVYGGANNKEIGGLLRAEGGSGAFGWRFTGIGRRADNIQTPTGNEQTPTGDIFDTGFHAINGELALGVHGEKASGSIRYERYGGDFAILDGPPVEEDNVSGPLRRLDDHRVQATTNWQLGGGTRLETKSQWQRHSLKELVGESRVGTEQPSFDLLLNTVTTDVLLHHVSGNWLSGTIGASGMYQDNTTSGAFPLVPNATTSNGALFAFEQGTFGQWSVLAGVRGDVHRIAAESNAILALPSQVRNTSAFSGEIGLVYRPVEGLAIAGNLGRAFRSPTLFELFTNGPHLGEDRFEIGLAGAKPETSLNADLSVRWETGQFRGEIGAYRNQINNYLYIEPRGDSVAVTQDDGSIANFAVYQYKQTSNAVLQGVDISTEVAAHRNLTFRGRFDFVHATNEATNEPLPLIPPVRGDLEAEIHTAAANPANRAYFTVGTQMVAKQTRLGQFDEPTAGYALLHLGAGISRTFSGRQFYLDIRIRNATNRAYNDFLSRYKSFAYEQGRNVIFRLSTGL